MSVQIRKAAIGELEQIQAIARRAIDANYRSFLDDEGVTTFIESGASDQYIAEHVEDCWVLVDEECVKGMCVLVGNLIELLMVDHGAHRQGYGTRLLRYCEEQLFREYDELVLESYEGNDKANAFYRKNGWVERERILDEMTGVYKLVFAKGGV